MNQRRNTSNGKRDRKPAEPRICEITGHELRPRAEIVRITGLDGGETVAGAAPVLKFLEHINPNFRTKRGRKVQVAPGVWLARGKRGDFVLDGARLIHMAPDGTFAKFTALVAPNQTLLRQVVAKRIASRKR
jgi:hypothetical protein